MLGLTGALLFLLLIYQFVAQAIVAGQDITARDEDLSTSKRSLFNIVWGCISTTIICAWAAIHPNIAPREGPLKRTLRRLELVFWAIVAPEILPCWALNQLLAAMAVKDVYNKGKSYEMRVCGVWETVKKWISFYEVKEEPGPAWTIAHGHFLVMGGFHVVEPPEVPGKTAEANMVTQQQPQTNSLLVNEYDTYTEKRHCELKGRVTILTLELLEKLVKDPDFEIQTTEEEITNRSKGDALSKLIFILQSTWFILQCVGRRIQGLNLTQLELTTLALASLNGITFILWWDKPLGAQAVVRVHLKRKLTDSERVPHENDRSVRSNFLLGIPAFFEGDVSAIRNAFRYGQPEGLIMLPLAILLLLLSPILVFTAAFFATILDLTHTKSTSFPPDDTHVPTFYVPKHRYSKRCHILLLNTLGVVFGGIHCFGWNFSFPTYAEQKLWRVASLALTIIPVATLPLGFIIRVLSTNSFRYGLGMITLIFCTLAYVSARLILVGLALALLRNLPQTAFIAVNWTKFYPHFL